MRFVEHLALGYVLFLMTPNCVVADVVKTDLRSASSPREFFVAFCVAKAKSSQPLTGLAEGSVGSGYQWVQIASYSNASVVHPPQGRSNALFDACARSALINKASLFIAGIDESVFEKMEELLARPNNSAESQKESNQFTKVASELASAAGLHGPDSGISPSDFVEQLSAFNPGRSQDGVEWVWQPPTLRLVAHDKPATTVAPGPQYSLPSSSIADDNSIPTGVDAVTRVDRFALQRFYQAVADAEDNASNYYDVEFQIQDGVLARVYVHPLGIRRDAETDKGDSLCVFFSGDPVTIDPVDLVDHLLQLSDTNSSEVSASWGFYSIHPLLGTPRNWQAAVTSTPACYLSTTSSAELVSRIAPTPRITYGATLIRGFPRYPRDQAAFNFKAPVQLTQSSAESKGITETARHWRTYRAYVEQLRSYAERRSGSYPGLSSSEIAKRRVYARSAAAEDELFWNIRKDFALREVGWHQFVDNRYRGLQDEALERYTKGIPVFYSTVANDNSQLEPFYDLAPFLRKQMNDYQVLMSISVLSKEAATAKYQPNLTVRGNVCDVQPADCKRSAVMFQEETPKSLLLSIANQSQSKYNNVVDLGVFSIASPQTDPVANFVPTNGVCQVLNPGTRAQEGNSETKVTVTNKGDEKLTLTLASIGSWTEAEWEDKKESDGFRKELGAGESATFRLKFYPGVGYEDLNLVYILKDGEPLAELTLNYSIVGDPLVKTFSVDTPGFQSGASDGWLYYDLAVSQVPPMYSVSKACVWVSGDRNDCAHTQWCTCGVKNLTDDLVKVNFGLQGHTDDPSAKRFSSGHMWVGYELVSQPINLH